MLSLLLCWLLCFDGGEGWGVQWGFLQKMGQCTKMIIFYLVGGVGWGVQWGFLQKMCQCTKIIIFFMGGGWGGRVHFLCIGTFSEGIPIESPHPTPQIKNKDFSALVHFLH